MVLAVSLFLSLTQGGRFQLANPLPALPPIILDQSIQFEGPAKKVCEKYGLQGRMLWIDATANIERYNSEEKIVELIAKIKEVGFNTVVLDVKPLSSEMVYPSAFAPKLLEWKGKNLGDFDPLGPMSREAKKHGLQFFVSMNAFCDGHRLVNRGPGFQRPDEQSVVYEPTAWIGNDSQKFEVSSKLETGKVALGGEAPTGGFSFTVNKKFVVQEPSAPLQKGGFTINCDESLAEKMKEIAVPGNVLKFSSTAKFVPIGESQDKQYPLMTSPTHPVVRRRLIDIAKEVTTKYNIDGIIYDDRLRYTGINGDFSELTRSKFEQHIGKKIQWPNDVFEFTYSYNNGLTRGLRPGPFYEQWLAWRASILKGFVKEVRSAVRAIKPRMQLGVYAGSWYGDYQQYGNNWAAQSLDAGFWFLTPEYKKSGMADDLDLLVTGCYYPTPTIHDAMVEGKGLGFTVEAAGSLSYRAVHDQTFVYAGLSLMDFKDNPEGLEKSLQAAVATTNGVMVFDLSHDIEPMWNVFANAFKTPKKAPTTGPFDLQEVRRMRSLLERRGVKEPVIPIITGAAGIGF
jgi:hypothetical protein